MMATGRHFYDLSTDVFRSSFCARPGSVYHLRMRRTPLLLSLSLLLAACGGSSGTTATCDQQYWDGKVGTCLPENWHVVTTADLQTRGAPGEVVVAFQANDSIAGRFPLVTVTSQSLTVAMDPVTFDAQNRTSVKTLPGYTLVDEKKTVIDGEDLMLHIFTAQPVAEQAVQRFYQISSSVKDKGYTFTGVLPLSVNKETEAAMMTIMTHVTFTDPDSKK